MTAEEWEICYFLLLFHSLHFGEKMLKNKNRHIQQRPNGKNGKTETITLN